MTIREQTGNVDYAAKMLAIEVISEILATTSSNQLPEKLIEQIHELTGSKTVMLLVHPNSQEISKLVYSCPLRREQLFSPLDLEKFCPTFTPDPLPVHPQEFPEDHPLRTLLLQAKVESIIRFALHASGELVGTLLLLDVPEPARISDVIQTITPILPLTAMALKNAIAHIHIEHQAQQLAVLAAEREVHVVQKTSELNSAMHLLRANEELHRAILQTAMDGFWLTDTTGHIQEVNRTYCRMSGYSEQELLSMKAENLDADETPGEISKHMQLIIDKGEGCFETRHRRKDQSLFDLEVSVQYRPREHDGFIVFLKDITARKIAENEILHSLNEKETMLREIYHRTKNTLQVVRGLLVLHADEFPENTEVQQLVKCTEERIQAIALVHQMLYASKNLSSISIDKYLQDLSENIFQNSGQKTKNIHISYELEPHEVLIDSVIPLGLILNELLTNSIRHAFTDRDYGQISIQLHWNSGESAIFQYADNGIGVPDDFNFRAQTSLGLKLIHSLSEKQLLGSVQFKNSHGIQCIIEIPKSHYKARL